MSSRCHQPVMEPNRWNVVSPLISERNKSFFKPERWFLWEGWSFLRYQLMLDVMLKRILVCVRVELGCSDSRGSQISPERKPIPTSSAVYSGSSAIISLSFFYQTIVERADFHSSFFVISFIRAWEHKHSEHPQTNPCRTANVSVGMLISVQLPCLRV